jgi:energy-coupling factor transport system ATP-binding protein
MSRKQPLLCDLLYNRGANITFTRIPLTSLIQFDAVTYRHPGAAPNEKPALNGVSVSIQPGEWVAIVGANGSGKTTFARHCNALLLPTSGRVLIDGRDTQNRSTHTYIRSRIGMVFQNPEDQIVSSIIEEDCAFGPENLAIPTAEIRQRVERSLKTVEMYDQRERPPHLLSAGQMQRVALAGVLAMQPDCVIFDESTAMLDPRGRLEVLNTMRVLHERGTTVLFITHFMEEAARADRALVFNRGQIVSDSTPGALFADLALLKSCGLEQPSSLQLLSGLHEIDPILAHLPQDFETSLRQVPRYPGALHLPSFEAARAASPAVVQVSHLSHTYMAGTPMESKALVDVSFEINSGQSHGLAGATGSGKSTLLQHLNGLYRPQSGDVRIGPYSVSDPALDIKALRRYAGLVFQNPEIYFFKQYVGDEIAYGPRLLYGHDGLRERVQSAMQLVGLDFETFKDRLTYRLSGGEKRKVALAATLALQPKVLVLDEPTAGLDPASRRNLHDTLRGFQRDGIEMILSSHSMGDIAELATNLTIMAKGRALRTGNTAELFNDAQLIEEGALGQPAVVRLAAAFRAQGWPIPVSVVTAAQFLAAVQSSLGKEPA